MYNFNSSQIWQNLEIPFRRVSFILWRESTTSPKLMMSYFSHVTSLPYKHPTIKELEPPEVYLCHMKLMDVILPSRIRVISWSGSSEPGALCDVSSKCQTLVTGAYWQHRASCGMSGVINKHRTIVKLIVFTLMLLNSGKYLHFVDDRRQTSDVAGQS